MKILSINNNPIQTKQNKKQNPVSFKAVIVNEKECQALGKNIFEGIRQALLPKGENELFSNIHRIGKNADIIISPVINSRINPETLKAESNIDKSSLYIALIKGPIYKEKNFSLQEDYIFNPKEFAKNLEAHIVELFQKSINSYEPGIEDDNVFKYAHKSIFEGIKLTFTPQKDKLLSKIQELEAKAEIVVQPLYVAKQPDSDFLYIGVRKKGSQHTLTDKVYIKGYDKAEDFEKSLERHIFDTFERAH